jgi:MraZ protein
MASSDVKEQQAVEPGNFPRAGVTRPLFTWKYKHGVDGQGRIQFPSKWKMRSMETELIAVVLRHELTEKDYILVLPYDLFNQFSTRLHSDSFTASKAQAVRHDYAERIMGIDLDGAGRFMLPGELRTPAKLEKEALLVGCIDRFEIWNPSDYEDAREKEKVVLKADKNGNNTP